MPPLRICRVAAALILVLVLTAICLVSPCAGEDDPPLPLQGTWDIRTLLPGTSPIPPTHALTITGDVAAISPLSRGRVAVFAAAAGRALGLISGAISDAAAGSAYLCRFPSGLDNLTLRAERIGPKLSVDCNEGLLSTLAATSVWPYGAVVRASFPNGLPLSARTSSSGSCKALPWRVKALSLQHPASNRLVAVFHMTEQTAAGDRPCSAYFELIHVTPEQSKDLRSYLGPVAMICIFLAVRTLPRYYLQKTGSIDADTFRSTKPPSLTPGKRAELLQQQRDVIAQMRRQDGLDAE